MILEPYFPKIRLWPKCIIPFPSLDPVLRSREPGHFGPIDKHEKT